MSNSEGMTKHEDQTGILNSMRIGSNTKAFGIPSCQIVNNC
jgi:hypothetical protein